MFLGDDLVPFNVVGRGTVRRAVMSTYPPSHSTSQQIGLKKLGRLGKFLEHDDLPYASIPVRNDIAASP